MNQLVHLHELIINQEQIKILEYFLEKPTNKIVQKELINSISISKGTVIKWLKFFIKIDFIAFELIGVNKLYYLNNNNLIVKEFKKINILLKLNNLDEIPDTCEVYLYGSYARGDYNDKSDIDLLIIGNTTKRDIIKVTDNLAKKLDKPINFKIFNTKEWSTLSRKDPAFFNIVEKDKIRIK